MYKSLLSIIVIVVAITACQTKASDINDNSKEVSAFPLVELTQNDTVLQSNYVAAINARQNVEIRAKVSGYLEKIFVDEGKEVKQGELLFQLNAKEFQIALEKARAAVASARADAKAVELEKARVKLLVDKKIISASEYELADAKLKAAEARVREAQSVEAEVLTKLSYTQIRAPFSGIIDRIPLKLGSLVGEGALLTTVSDISGMHVYFNISENEYLQLVQSKAFKKDSSAFNGDVNLILADGSVYPHTGKIKASEGEFDQGTGAIAFRASFPNPEKILKHGATGKIQITKHVSDVLLVPQKSVFEIQDKNYVFVVDKNQVAHMKNFVPAARLGDCYVVQSGLNPSDRIVFEGAQNIRDGERIAITH